MSGISGQDHYESNKFVTICNMLFDEDSETNTGLPTLKNNQQSLKQELLIENLHSFTLQVNLEKTVGASSYLTPELELALDSLRKCSTFVDEHEKATKKTTSRRTKMYFWVNSATKKAFRQYFKTADHLFRHLYFFNLLNHGLISTNTRLKISDSRSGSYENLSDWIPKPEIGELRFSLQELIFTKTNHVKVNYRKLSDGEHQLLHVFGSMILMDKPGTLFLYDEPETHFNPGWRSKFISLVNECITNDRDQEILLTTHSPFIISDSLRENVIIFEKEDGKVITKAPPIKTFGTSVSIITDQIFNKEETLSAMALDKIQEIKAMPMETIEQIAAAKEATRVLGESPEKILLFREILLKEDGLNSDA